MSHQTQDLWIKKHNRAVSLTPLIDVVFILLLFFMLSTQFTKQTSIKIQTPASSESATDIELQSLILHSNGKYSLNTSDVRAAQPFDKIIMLINPAKPLLLHPQTDVSVQDIVTALEALKAAHVQKFTLGNTVTP